MISSIPNYFNNSETPIICYKYNKPIRSTIFNFNKIVNDIDIDSNTPASWVVKILIIYIPLQGMLLLVILMSFLALEFAILFLKVLNIDFSVILISLNVVERLNRKVLNLMPWRNRKLTFLNVLIIVFHFILVIHIFYPLKIVSE